jgi:hypothetical protein
MATILPFTRPVDHPKPRDPASPAAATKPAVRVDVIAKAA